MVFPFFLLITEVIKKHDSSSHSLNTTGRYIHSYSLITTGSYIYKRDRDKK